MQIYNKLAALSSKPMMFAEWGSAEPVAGDPVGVTKGQWIIDSALALGSQFPRIKAVVWFSENGGVFALDSSASSLAGAKIGFGACPAPGPTPTPTACTSVTASAAPASPQAAGTPVTITASSAGCNPRYEFWILPPGGSWTIAQAYSSTATFSWTATGLAGAYGVEVDVRDASESVSYDAVTNITYQLNGCSAASLGANPTSPHAPSSSVTLTATATCPGTPTYRFWVKAPSGPWTVVQDYSTTNTFGWNTTGQPLGSYGLEVDVRNQGGTDSYEKVSNLTYVLALTPCTTPTLAPNPASPGATGSTVTLTATTSGCTNPRFRFWVQDPGRAWSMVQDYSPAMAYTWTQTGLAGSYKLEVDVRDQSETVSYDAVKNLTYVLNGCSAVSISANPPSPQAHGTQVVFTATAACPGTPVYKFWLKTPGANWTVVQPYGTGNTFTWASPATPGVYYIEVDVEDQGATDTYEKVNTITFVLT
jgi:hypothetical protein